MNNVNKINGISVDQSNLLPLHDEERRESALTYFYGAVTRMTLAEASDEVLRIWQSARKHLKEVYLVSDYADEDLHVFEMEMARCVIQRASQLNIVPPTERLFDFSVDEQDRIARITDWKLKQLVKVRFMDTVDALNAAQSREEVLKIHEGYERYLDFLYKHSWAKRIDLPIWFDLMNRRLAGVAKKWDAAEQTGGGEING